MVQGSRTPSNNSRRTRNGRRLNRAEQQAMEIRRAETARHILHPQVPAPTTRTNASGPGVGEPVMAAAVADGTATATPAASPTAASIRRRRNARETARTIHLTRSQEYDFIRADMRRLFILSAALVVLMIIALVVIENMV